MRAVAKAAPRPQTTPVIPPPDFREHEVTLCLHEHVYRTAKWAYAYEQRDDVELARIHRGRSFEQFLAEAVEAGLEYTVRHWEATQT